MADEADAAATYKIEPFDPELHDRTAFSCGSDRIDNYLKRTAKKHQKGDFTRVWIAADASKEGKHPILGYYAINAHGVEGEDLPNELTKNAPNHGYIPAGYISIVGVDGGAQGKGLGRVLLIDALKRFAVMSEEVGLAVVLLDVLDEGGPEAMERRSSFYKALGFQSLPTRQTRMYISIKTVRAVFAE